MNNLRVLVIDDEEELVEALVERLEYRNISARGALSGPEGLALLKEKDISLVLLDLKLPGMSGLEVLRVIKTDYPQIKVLLFTGHGTTNDTEDNIPEGAFDYLPKPLDFNILISKMQEAVNGD